MFFHTSSGRITLKITKEHARIGFHSGECDGEVGYLRTVPAIKRQLDKLDRETLAQELVDYSDWDVSDHDANLSRILWIACGDIVEGGK